MNNPFHIANTNFTTSIKVVKTPKALTTFEDLQFSGKTKYSKENKTLEIDFSQGGTASAEVTLKSKTAYSLSFNIHVISNVVQVTMKVIDDGTILLNQSLDPYSIADYRINSDRGVNTFIEFSAPANTSNFVIHDLKLTEVI